MDREELFDCLIKVQTVPFSLTHLTSHISQVTCLDLGIFAELGHLRSFGTYKRLFAWLLSLWLLHGAWRGDRKDIFFRWSFSFCFERKSWNRVPTEILACSMVVTIGNREIGNFWTEGNQRVHLSLSSSLRYQPDSVILFVSKCISNSFLFL